MSSRSTTLAAALICIAALGPAASASADIRLDESFGGDGLVEMPFAGQPAAIATDDDSTVVAGSDGEIVVARLDATGQLDPGFGAGGVSRPFPGLGASVSEIAVTPGGEIVLAGEANPNLVLAARLTPAGAPDPAFGEGGLRTFPWHAGSAGGANGMDLDSQGRILLGGSGLSEVANGGGDAYMARLTPGGDLDESFAGDGTASTGAYVAPPGYRSSDDGIGPVVANADGGACGYGTTGHGNYFNSAVYCFAANGTPLPVQGGSGETSFTDAVATSAGEPLTTSSRLNTTGSPQFGFTSWLDGELTMADDTYPTTIYPAAVDLLDADTAVIGGRHSDADRPRRPAFWIVDRDRPEGALELARIDTAPGADGQATDVAGIDPSSFVAILEEDARQANPHKYVARLTTLDPPAPEEPAATPPPRDRGSLTLGELRGPKSIDGLLRLGARVGARCSVDCRVALELRASRRSAERLDLPSRRLDRFRGELSDGLDYTVRFGIKGKAARALFERRDQASGKLRMRVVTRSVSYSD